MSRPFEVRVTTLPGMLRNPPPQFGHLGLVYTPLCVRVANLFFPIGEWCDFTGVLLLRWNREVRNLISHHTRYARLVFTDTPSEVWFRRTTGPWWKASCVTRQGRTKAVVAESLCIPERVEASLHSASAKLLRAVQEAGVWTEDCAALQAFLDAPDGRKAGSPHPVEGLPRPGNTPSAQNPFRNDPLPRTAPGEAKSEAPGSFGQGTVPGGRRGEFPSSPLLCPRCGAVLRVWGKGQMQQACPLCSYPVHRG